MSPHGYDIDLAFFLKKIPLFSSIPGEQLKKVVGCFQCLSIKKDTVIFNQGDSSDALYIIRSGIVRIESQTQSHHYQTELKRGDFFGEMALLSDMPRNATVKAGLDTVLFQLKKENFDDLLSANRQIGLYLSRLYARRLSCGIPAGQSRADRSVFYTLSSTHENLGLSHFLYSVSYHISTESSKKVLVVEPHLELGQVMKKYELHDSACPDEGLLNLLPAHLYKQSDFRWFAHPSGFAVLQVNKGFKRQLVPALSVLMENLKTRYDIVFFSLSHHFGALEQQAIRLSDKNLLLINNTRGGLESVKKKFTRLEKHASNGFDKVRVGVSHLCGDIGIARETLKEELDLSETPQIWVDQCDQAFSGLIDTRKRFPVKGARAVAREIAGVRIGLALGAGAARGWSHIGVLKTLQDHGIHIDMIAGTSMGALVGAIFSAKGSSAHLKQTTIDLFPTRKKARKGIFDYTLPITGFLRGKKALNLVAQAVGHADFMDLLIPTYLIGVDIIRGEEILFETGDVAKAVRSSLSLPAVFSPVRHKGRWMVDGGLLNPVPVNVLEQKGADKIIAVCVENPMPTPDRAAAAPGIFEVISRTMHIVHQRATTGFAEKSDVVIYPDVQGFAWDDFHKGAELMQRGIRACETKIDEIKTLIN